MCLCFVLSINGDECAVGTATGTNLIRYDKMLDGEIYIYIDHANVLAVDGWWFAWNFSFRCFRLWASIRQFNWDHQLYTRTMLAEYRNEWKNRWLNVPALIPVNWFEFCSVESLECHFCYHRKLARTTIVVFFCIDSTFRRIFLTSSVVMEDARRMHTMICDCDGLKIMHIFSPEFTYQR